MTVSSETNRSGPYNGNGVTTAFDYEFSIFGEDQVRVVKNNSAGVETTLVLGADYSVTGVGNAEGGQVICTVAPATGETITNLLLVPFTQETDLENQGAYLAEVVERALDLAAKRDLQLAEGLRRAVKLPASSAMSGDDLGQDFVENIDAVAGVVAAIPTVAGISADVQAVADIAADVALLADNSAILSGTASAVYAAEDVFTGDGSDTTWVLSATPASKANVDVWVGGQIKKTSEYSLAGNVLTIAPAVANGVAIIAKTRVQVSANDVYDARDQALGAASSASDDADAAAASAIEAAAALTSKADVNNPTFAGGPEGGQINLKKPDGTPGNETSLSDDVAVDLAGNRLRIYEKSSPFRGATLDIVEGGSPSVAASMLTDANAKEKAVLAFHGWLRDNTPGPSLISRVTDRSNGDWAGYINQCVADVAAVSPVRGGEIQVGAERFTMSSISAIMTNNIRFRGPGWTSRDLSSGPLITLVGAGSAFTWGDTSVGNVQGGGMYGLSFNANPKSDGRVIDSLRCEFMNFEQVYMDQPQKGVLVWGGLQNTFRDVHIEGYKQTGFRVDGTVNRVDRVNLYDVRIAGAGTEAAILATGPALDIDGNVHTMDCVVVSLVKADRGIRILGGATRDTMPHFLTFVNLQIDYTANENIRIEKGEDIKILGGYFNTTHSGHLISVTSTDAAEITIAGARLRGAKLSSVAFAGKTMIVDGCTMQNWNTVAGTNPAIDLVSGFDDVIIKGCSIGAVGKDGAGGGAGQRAVRINAGTGKSSIYGNKFNGLHATPIENNGSGALTVNGDNQP